MATSWSTARTAIASIIEAVSITTPIAESIKKVFQTQPANIADFPCVIIMGAAKRVTRPPSLRSKYYDVRVRLVIRGADLARSADVIDAFEEAIIDAFDNAVKFNLAGENYLLMEGPNWEEPGMFDIGGQAHSGADAILSIKLQDAKAFAP